VGGCGPDAWLEFLASMANELPADMRDRVRHNDQAALAASVAEDRPDISEQAASSWSRCSFSLGTEILAMLAVENLLKELDRAS